MPRQWPEYFQEESRPRRFCRCISDVLQRCSYQNIYEVTPSDRVLDDYGDPAYRLAEAEFELLPDTAEIWQCRNAISPYEVHRFYLVEYGRIIAQKTSHSFSAVPGWHATSGHFICVQPNMGTPPNKTWLPPKPKKNRRIVPLSDHPLWTKPPQQAFEMPETEYEETDDV